MIGCVVGQGSTAGGSQPVTVASSGGQQNGPAPTPGPGPGPMPGPPIGQCPADQAYLAGRCFSFAGTAWQLTTDMPEGRRMFLITFHPGGQLTSGDPVDTTFDDDDWQQEGNLIHFWFNHRYVEHRATLAGDRSMSGAALNVRGQTWSWSALRVR